MERLFATQHNWAKKWTRFNFEARGTSGPHVNGNKWEMVLLKNLLQQTLLSSIKLIDVQYL
jgi:hypothetical protein